MISIKRANEASAQALLFISITRSSGWKVVIGLWGILEQSRINVEWL